MSEIYKNKWKGSEIPEVKSGIATFECGVEKLDIHLSEFSEFQNLVDMFDAVMEQTYYKARSDFKSKIDGVFKS